MSAAVPFFLSASAYSWIRSPALELKIVQPMIRPFGRVIGCTILSAHAGDLIHEVALALKKKGTAADISGMIHVYPTLAQANKRASDQYFAEKFFGGRIPKLMSWWLKRVRPRPTQGIGIDP